jgi:prevent-host-death family protein
MNYPTVPARELRRQLAEYLDGALAGETVVVTRGGRPTATLAPVPREDTDDD